ncbi:hypothetical protein E1B28_009419 [Marasmius oreades]|uniref:Uncharacterized protein n=1 Tax=Marasmius oreades TaxID=181124 RepID=A0A9P7UUA9_9AGAR|nr:uncharacterized protein E1B28_009419 [Marasmius oreades]KAG7093136.1 hypothetical protein E1B28_009419 [Marasmius oreades]
MHCGASSILKDQEAYPTHAAYPNFANTGQINELVWAILGNGPNAEGWVVEPAPGDLPNTYRISTNDKKSRWVILEGDKDAQIECRPLGTGHQDVFQFVHVVD